LRHCHEIARAAGNQFELEATSRAQEEKCHRHCDRSRFGFEENVILNAVEFPTIISSVKKVAAQALAPARSAAEYFLVR